jgi:deazaflavin-dependent oxidoreductase (nitroreductase family)
MSGDDDRVIAEFRANGGEVPGFGSGLVLLHSVGARSGERRVTPVAAIQEGGSWLICASRAGARTDPAWYCNLLEHPDATVETPLGSVDVHAIDLEEEDEWEAAFARFTDRSPAFAQYRADAAPRRMPILRLEPRG